MDGTTGRSRVERGGVSPGRRAPGAGGGRELVDEVRRYWNERIHDLEMTDARPGTRAFFDDLEEYRYDKLRYLDRAVDFGGYAGERVLEIGGGIGTDLLRFARGGARVTGVELSERATRLARANFDAAGERADLLVADGGRAPLPSDAFDLVYCHGVLQYAARPEAIVREAHRVLRPGGEAVFMVYNRRSWLAALSWLLGVGLEHDDAPAFRLYTRAEFERMLEPFPEVRITPERFPVRTRLHGGARGALYNGLFVPSFNGLPRSWVRPLGWHLMASCRKAAGAHPSSNGGG